jgi:hypothetical protein
MLRDFKMDYVKKKIVYFEVALLVFSMFAFPYMISEEEDNLLFSFTSYIFDKISEPTVPLVSAAINGCCAESKAGVDCSVINSDLCKDGEDFAPGVICEQTPYCQVGCCYDEEVGLFDERVLETNCEKEWIADPNCNLPGATLGCCILGEGTRFETSGQCRLHTEVFALSSGFEVDWRTGLNELECVMLAGQMKVGACVLANKGCKFGTEADCIENAGEFAENYLCTAERLETTCERTQKTTCVEGKDQVYFMDSCGNVANIYDSNRAHDDSYWERYILPESACSASNGAMNSPSCGNCNRFNGGICALASVDNFNVNMGDYYCRDTMCEFTDFWGQEHLYKNGESWCVYDGPIDGNNYGGSANYDVPGSRHFRYVCNSGDVQIEPCADYRNEVCIQQNTLASATTEFVGSDNVEFYNAVCRKNNAKHCIEIGEQSDQACNEEPDCRVRRVEVAGTFSFSICVPRFPEGFSFEPTYRASGAQICSINTRTCVVSFEPQPVCICVDNCGCLAGSFKTQMDAVCKSLGDCGSSPNYKNVNPVREEYAHYDPRVEKYMKAAGLTHDDYLGAGSALFEQSAFSGSMFSKKLDQKKSYTPSGGGGGGGGGAGAAMGAIGAVLAGVGAIIGSTLMAVAGAALSAAASMASAAQPKVCPPVIVPYSCNLWQAPGGGGSCSSCNDPEVPCTDYRCRSLGSGCEFINEGTDDAICITGADDGQFPVVTPITDMQKIIENENLYEFPELLEFMQNVTYSSVTNSLLKITNLNGGCLDAYSPIPISFTTQKPALCKFDVEQKDFEDMAFFVGIQTFVYDHSTFFQLPDPSHGQSQGLDIESDLSIYILCQDRFGHEMPEYLQIDMCVKEGEDETPPRIVTTFPKDGEYVSTTSTNQSVSLITNELSVCKWDLDGAKTFEEMANTFECNDDFSTPSSLVGYTCSGDLPISSVAGVSENHFFIKCQDQPWLIGTSNEGKRNANVESYELVFIKPSSKIKIDSVSPEGELITTADKLTIELKVKTSKGAYDHNCEYSLSGYDLMIPFFETGVPGMHFNEFNLQAGKYDVFIKCEDETGDSAEVETSFRVLKKNYSPLISRVWQASNNLYMVTQEDADCRYSADNCMFNFEDGGAVSGDGITHRIQAKKGSTYHVKCKDDLGNVPNGCSIVLTAV